MTVDASQNVGIGTASPSYKLDVSGNARFTGSISQTGATDNYFNQANVFYSTSDGTSGGTVRGAIKIGDSSSNIIFYNGASATERMRILGTGNILSLSGGSTSATGTGIAFPAVQSASSDANTLDDYEEGTFTPTFDNLTVGNGTSQGRYTKIGRTVFVEVDFVWGSTTSASGTWYVNNLPFTTAATFLAYGSGNILDSGTENYTCLAATNASNTLMRPLANNASVTYLANAGVTATVPMTWTTNDAVRMTLVYTT